MDTNAGAGSPAPLQALSPERVNQQHGTTSLGLGLGLNSSVMSVTDKISQFNSLATQSKHLERKTADAALKRAMVGREEAESEMRRCRDEVRALKKQVDEGRDRERRVGERLESVMENYGRAKETHAHTQALWEKEIRRARKETFKSQSAIVKLQEELKAARTAAKAADEALAHEKQRSKEREQEAFQARYDLVGCQEELEQALQKMKMIEQERDAFRSLAKSEEDVARIASEGRLPLPPPSAEEAEEELVEAVEAVETVDTVDTVEAETAADSPTDDTFLTVPKQRSAKTKASASRRVSSLHDIKSSASSEAEIDELTRLWLWEKQRADRSSDLVEFLEAECHLRACACMKKRPRGGSMLESARKRPTLDIADGGDRIILSESVSLGSPTARIRASLSPKKTSPSKLQQSTTVEALVETAHDVPQSPAPRAIKSPRLNKSRGPRPSMTIFVPEEGIFRTVSQEIAEDVERAVSAAATAVIDAMPEEPTPILFPEEPTPILFSEEPVPNLFPEEPTPILFPDEPLPTTEHDEAVDVPADRDTEHGNDTEHDDTEHDDNADEGNATDAAYAGENEKSMYARTPSVEPPTFAQPRTSLLSLLDAPHRQEPEQPINFYVPTTPGPDPSKTMAPARAATYIDIHADSKVYEEEEEEEEPRRPAASILVSSTAHHTHHTHHTHAMAHVMDEEMDDDNDNDNDNDGDGDGDGDGEITEEIEQSRISDVTGSYGRSVQREPVPVFERQKENESTHTVRPQSHRLETIETIEPNRQRPAVRPTTQVYSHTKTVSTTKVPLRAETTDPSLAQRIMAAQRTPQGKVLAAEGADTAPTFDITNPALTPTMTREECLAQIRERRGRARSAAGASATSTTSQTSAPGSVPGSRSGSGSGSGSGARPASRVGSGSATASGAIMKPAARRPVTPGRDRRDVSAPVRRVASNRRVRP